MITVITLIILLQVPTPFPTPEWSSRVPAPRELMERGSPTFDIPSLSPWGMADDAIQIWASLGEYTLLCQGVLMIGIVLLGGTVLLKFIRGFTNDQGRVQ